MGAWALSPKIYTSMLTVRTVQYFYNARAAFISPYFHSLTAWPLIRDVFFYSISLVVLVVFFDDQFIYWYEALILFLWYGAYVGFMKFNEPVEDSLRSLFKLPKIVS